MIISFAFTTGMVLTPTQFEPMKYEKEVWEESS